MINKTKKFAGLAAALAVMGLASTQASAAIIDFNFSGGGTVILAGVVAGAVNASYFA